MGSGSCGEKYDVFTDTWISTGAVRACLVPQEWTPGFTFFHENCQLFCRYSQVLWIYSQVWLRFLPGRDKWEIRRDTLKNSDSNLLSLSNHNFSASVAEKNDVKFFKLENRENAMKSHHMYNCKEFSLRPQSMYLLMEA